MKNVLICVLVGVSLGFGIWSVKLNQDNDAMSGQLRELQRTVVALQSQLPPPLEEKERQFLAFGEWFQKVAVGWEYSLLGMADNFRNVRVPMSIDAKDQRIVFEFSIYDQPYKADLSFIYDRGKWMPQWDRSYIQKLDEHSRRPLGARVQMGSGQASSDISKIEDTLRKVLTPYLLSDNGEKN
jgi:hypothetical protein